MQLFNKINLPKKAGKFLFILLAGDLFYVLLHLSNRIAVFFDAELIIRDPVFQVSKDLGLAESYQYTKEFWIFILLTWLIFRRKKYFYTGWALLFAYLLFDDMLSIHEHLATFTLTRFGVLADYELYASLRYQDFGELGVSVFFGVIFLSIIVTAYIRGGEETRTTFHYLLGGLLFIVFFGVGNDTLNRLIVEENQNILYEISGLIEDGGEMIGMSFVSWYVYTITDSEPDNSQMKTSS